MLILRVTLFTLPAYSGTKSSHGFTDIRRINATFEHRELIGFSQNMVNCWQELIMGLTAHRKKSGAALIPSFLLFKNCHPNEQKLVLRRNHMLGDGNGAVLLLQNLFAEMQRLSLGEEILNDGPWGAEVQSLASGAFDAARVPHSEDSSPTPRLLQPQADSEIFQIPSVNTAHTPGANKTQSLDFSEDQTSEILGHAKTLNVGLTAFLHAALIHAGKKLAPRPGGAIRSTVLILNYRNRCTTNSPPTANSRAAAL
ncbi:hypothetical protein BJY01DRAFT_246683 [Aspergillus pseudoustus]|uniref:Condensation domain-containing protein n=1 Tax=Aspergillus pseudoustus TaxID=1810923 RepID=A0ABR4K8Z8_9EURO